jgi:predicted deacylase
MAKNKYISYAVIVLIITATVLLFIYNIKNDKVISETQIIDIVKKPELSSQSTIGTSTLGAKIESYTYGNEEKKLLIVGGMHGGYEWNSSLLAYELIDYFDMNKGKINNKIKVNIIPSINPDALYKVTGIQGRFIKSNVKDSDLSLYRFNNNKVDLNRNFDCNWQKESVWKNKTVNAGSAPFSEKETWVLRDYILKEKPSAVIFLHSSAGAVYASECNNGVLQATKDIMKIYSKSSGYKAVEKFDSYKVTGDAEGWLASIGIPAITVELSTHQDTEYGKNIKGVLDVIDYLAK